MGRGWFGAVELIVAVILIPAPFIPPTEAGITGAVLYGSALVRATWAELSARFTDQPQCWPAVPALFVG